MAKKAKMTLGKLAQITAKGFLETNDKIEVVRTELKETKKELKADIKDLKNSLGQTDKDIFTFERIQMAEVERNDRQDVKIKQLETKVLK
jgi:hypothetical protein